MYDEAKAFYENSLKNGVNFNSGKFHFYYSCLKKFRL